MSKEKEELFLLKLIEELDLDDDINLNSSLDDLGWDSLSVITTIAVYDEVYDITIDIEELKNCKTLQDIVNISKS